VLTGMNEHGRAGVARVIGAIAAIAGAFVALGPFGGGLTAVGVAVAAPLVVVDGIYLPMIVCRRLAIPMSQFVREAAGRPVLCGLPLALSFFVARTVYADRAWLALASGMAGAILLGGPLYWRYAVRDVVSTLFRNRFRARVNPAAPPQPPDHDSGEDRR